MLECVLVIRSIVLMSYNLRNRVNSENGAAENVPGEPELSSSSSSSSSSSVEVSSSQSAVEQDLIGVSEDRVVGYEEWMPQVGLDVEFWKVVLERAGVQTAEDLELLEFEDLRSAGLSVVQARRVLRSYAAGQRHASGSSLREMKLPNALASMTLDPLKLLDFCQRLERLAAAHGRRIDDVWYPWVCSVLSTVQWNAANRVGLGRHQSWSSAQLLLRRAFVHPSTRQQLMANYFGLVQRRSESLEAYVERYAAARAEVVAIYPSLGHEPSLGERFIMSLLKDVREKVWEIRLLHQLDQQALSLEQASKLARDAAVLISTPSVSPISTPVTTKPLSRCSIHGECRHTDSTCRVQLSSRRASNTTSTPAPPVRVVPSPAQTSTHPIPPQQPQQPHQVRPRTPQASSAHASLTCYRCNKIGHIATHCTAAAPVRRTPTPSLLSFLQAPHQDAVFDSPTVHDTSAVQSDSLCVIAPLDWGSSPLITTVLVEGAPVRALVDTGASHTYVSPTTAESISLEYSPSSATSSTLLADGSSVCPGLANRSVHLKYGSMECDIRVRILTLPPDLDVILGCDVLPQLGIAIVGLLPTGSSDASSTGAGTSVNVSLRDLPPVAPAPRPAQHPSHAAVKQTIQPLLQANAALPENARCPRPEAVVHLDTGQAAPVWRRQYAVPQRLQSIVSDTVKRWISLGVVEPSTAGTQWNSPLLVVPKAGGRWRVCLDPRALNAVLTNGDNFPLPVIDELLSTAGDQATVFTTLDLAEGYHHLPVHPPDRHKLAFTWKNVQYVFSAAPFGLKHLPSQFQRLLTSILKDLPFVIVYIDDIVVFSKYITAHVHHVSAVIERLNDNNLRLRLEKCSFAALEVKLLGHLISGDGIRVDPDKVAWVSQIPRPTSGPQVASFLGLANYFRKFLPSFSSVAAPLETLRCKKGPVSLSATQVEAFETLKKLLANAPLLSFPHWDEPFTVATDASTRGLGAVIFQRIDDSPHLIQCVARALSTGERNYSATKLELAGILFALRKFRYYLFGRRFCLLTDHRALTFLFSQRRASRVMEAWFDELIELQFDVVHLPGLQNVLPDHLSRLFPRPERDSAVSTSCPLQPPPQPLLGSAAASSSAGSPVLPTQVRHRDGLTLVTDEAKKNELIQQAHLFGHFATSAMVDRIADSGYTWPSIRKDCQAEVDRCDACARYNIRTAGFHPIRSMDARFPMGHIAVDLATFNRTSPRGNNYILLLVDLCTRFVILRALPDKSSTSVAEQLVKIFALLGWPKIIQSDNGTEFINQLLKEIFRIAAVDHRTITPYHPQANGLAERNVQTSKRTLKKMLNGATTDWDRMLPWAQLAINTKVNALTGSSPFSLFFARPANLFADYTTASPRLLSHSELMERARLMEEVIFPAVGERKAASRSTKLNKPSPSGKITSFEPGSFVMVRDRTPSAGVLPSYEGPFKVVARTRGGAYRLLDTDGKPIPTTFAPSHLKLVAAPPADLEPSYQVESILDDRMRNNVREFLVKWKHYPSSANTWEPLESFDDLAIVDRYLKSVTPTSKQ